MKKFDQERVHSMQHCDNIFIMKPFTMTYETHQGMYHFVHFPGFTKFILDHHLEDFTKDLIALYYKVDVPILKYVNHLSPEEIQDNTIESNRELLTAFSNNKAKEYIEQSILKWKQNMLPFVDKYGIQAKDITLINYARATTLKKWLPLYTNDLEQYISINNEIDDLMLGYTTTSTDEFITILKEKLAEEENFNTNLIATTPSIIFIYFPGPGTLNFLNKRFAELTGYTADEQLMLKDAFKLVHPEDRETVKSFLERTSDRSESTDYIQYRILNKENQHLWLRCYAAAFENTQRQISKVLGVAYDITHEITITDSLKRSERQLLEAQQIARIGSFDWDIINDVSISSPQLRVIFESERRQTLEEMMQKVHGDDQDKLRFALQRAMDTGEMHCAYRYLAPSGEKIINARGKVHYDEAGKPVRMVGTIQDVTEQKHIEDHLLQRTLELKRSNQQLEEFAHVASHDLKEPLRKIAMFSNLILQTEKEELSDKVKLNLDKISESAQRMQQLIEDILAYSSINSSISTKLYSLQEALNFALENLEQRILESGAVITHNELPAIEVVPYQINQLFQNIIGNALKFVSKNRSPEIRIYGTICPRSEILMPPAMNTDRYLKIDITDNGIGFEETAKEKIFGLFQRLHARSHYEGSGLGLAICRRIMENHGGAIYASSDKERGATFTLIFPLM